MNVAILCFGEYREFKNAVKHWDFLNEPNVDIYVSTWDYSFETYPWVPDLNIQKEQFIKESDVLDYIPNANVLIHKHPYGNSIKVGKYSTGNFMKFHFNEGLKLIRESKKVYDILIMIRMDHVYIMKNHFNKFNKENCLFLCEPIELENVEYPFINDVFFAGKFEVVSGFIKNLPSEIDCSHIDFAKTVIKLGCETKPHDIDFLLGVKLVSTEYFATSTDLINDVDSVNKIITENSKLIIPQ
jgi:hypothetical protein